jgi:hypothetical protein
MTADGIELYILYQMGASEDWIWFSPIGVFLSEKALWDYVRKKGMPPDLRVLEPTTKNEILLDEPQEFVIVRSKEGEVPDVDLKESVRNL